MRTTIKDVAKCANVSIATVSRVLNRQQVASPEIKQQVIEASKKLNFIPSAIAQSLRQNKTQKIGMLVSDLSVCFFPAIIKVLEKNMAKYGYRIIVANCYDDAQTETQLIDNMVRDCVDAILLNPNLCNTQKIQEVQEKNLLVLSYDRHPDNCQFPSVYVDKAGGMYDLLVYLYHLGHRRFCFISGPIGLSTNVDRLNGAKRFMKEYNIPENDFIFCFGKYSGNYGYQIFQDTIFKDKAPTAYIGGSVSIMGGIIEFCNQIKIRIPKDVSLACFGTFQYPNLIKPAFVHVDDESNAIAEQLLSWLHTVLIENKTLPSSAERIIPAKLILGDSCGIPRKENLVRK